MRVDNISFISISMNCNERISPFASYLLDTISFYSHTLIRKINYLIKNLFNHVRLVIVVQWQYYNRQIIEERILNNVWRVFLYLMQIFANLCKSICTFDLNRICYNLLSVCNHMNLTFISLYFLSIFIYQTFDQPNSTIL